MTESIRDILQRTYYDPPESQIVFVFGSNLAGIHGAGAALDAVKYWGAIEGIGMGRQGDSYAIPTKDTKLRTRKLGFIERDVDGFVRYAREHPELDFQVTAVGCGLAGYSAHDIAPLFAGSPANCHLPLGWREIISEQFVASVFRRYV